MWKDETRHYETRGGGEGSKRYKKKKKKKYSGQEASEAASGSVTLVYHKALAVYIYAAAHSLLPTPCPQAYIVKALSQALHPPSACCKGK